MAAPGDFSKLNKCDELDDAYKAVTLAKAWDWLKQDTTPGPDGFMFCTHPMMNKINKHIKYSGHSGSSYAVVMRDMEFIAKNGWDEYAKLMV